MSATLVAGLVAGIPLLLVLAYGKYKGEPGA